MLLSGMVNAMPVPGISMSMMVCSPFCTALQTLPVTTENSTAFCVASSPKSFRISDAAVPLPSVLSTTSTP